MELKIEGKLRDGLFEWFKKRYYHSWELSWSVFPQSAQFGLLQEYAIKEHELFPYIYPCASGWRWGIDKTNGTSAYGYMEQTRDECWGAFKTSPEAQIAAIDQLNKIINDD